MADEILRKPTGAHVKLGTFVLLIILVAIAFGGAGLLYGINAGKAITATKTATATASATSSKTPTASATTTNVTANWKTYTNSEFGFSLKYPSDWKVEEKDTTGQGTSTLTSIELNSNPQFWASVIDLDKFASSIQNGTFTDRTLRGYVEYTKGKEGLTATTSNGNEVIKMSRTNLDNSAKISAGFFFIKDNKIFSVLAEYAKTDQNSASILDSILSTFQFTK